MSLLTKRTVVLAKVESVANYGVDAVPTMAANAVMAYDPEITINADMKERNPGNADISRYPELRGKTSFELKFWTELKGSGVVGTAPQYDPLFRACGLDDSIMSATSVTYAPISTGLESCTIYVNIDGILYKCVGCVGDVEIDLNAGEVGKLNWTFKGLYVLPTDIPLTTPTFDSTVPVIVKSTVMTFGNYQAIIEKLNLKLNNVIAERPDFNTTDGIKGFAITGRNPEASMTVEAVIMSTTNANFLSYFDTRAVKALSFVLGTISGNIVTILATYGYLRPPKIGDREGIRTFEIPFQLARSAGNDEISIALT